MPKRGKNRGQGPSSGSMAKYDSHDSVLEKIYGSLADLRREVAESQEVIDARQGLLNQLAEAADPQRAWILLEEYFNKLSLSRGDFSGFDWWAGLMERSGEGRLEALAMIFLRAERPMPPELAPYADYDRYQAWKETERQRRLSDALTRWLVSGSGVADSAKGGRRLRAVAVPESTEAGGSLYRLRVRFYLEGPETGMEEKEPAELAEMIRRGRQAQEDLSSGDWRFLEWVVEQVAQPDEQDAVAERVVLSGSALLKWLGTWGGEGRLEQRKEGQKPFQVAGGSVRARPRLQKPDGKPPELFFEMVFPEGKTYRLAELVWIAGEPPLVLSEATVYTVRNPPPASLLPELVTSERLPLTGLSQRLLGALYRMFANEATEWGQLCRIDSAAPRFVFELQQATLRVRLEVKSDGGAAEWIWTGTDWHRKDDRADADERPLILADARLDAAVAWLERLGWGVSEPGLWGTDADAEALQALAELWPERPPEAEYYGNASFQRLFLSRSGYLSPRFVVESGGDDWFSVSTMWDQADEIGLSEADREVLRTAKGPYLRLPDAGWVALDSESVASMQMTAADLGMDGLPDGPTYVNLERAAYLESEQFAHFSYRRGVEDLRQRVARLRTIPETALPEQLSASLRPYQKEGFDYLCHLARTGVGGILADDMGLGKTVQALALLAWMREAYPEDRKPALVICPASVLHNWQREAERFTPQLKVLLLESGENRHAHYERVPDHDLVVINYALLRRDIGRLKRFGFCLVILDEAQFIKNPAAQVTRSVKQLKGKQRLALTGTPLENRVLDLWSIMDFIEPNLLGSQSQFLEQYQKRLEDPTLAQWTRRRLAAKVRSVILRRMKQQVARDLPSRIEERLDCELEEKQRRLYRSELHRSRQEVFREVEEKGMAQSKLHVLAALTRLRQICCHPALIGSDAGSGKTATLFEILEPLLEEGQKVLIFSQFVQMLKILEGECLERGLKTYSLTGATKRRQDVVAAFQEEADPSVFLLSLRAAGTGLNLTSASYVILYDPWWNPSVEAQAIDRTHRIGQTRTVNAYRLITPGTVEEKIWNLQQKKARTISDVLGEEGFAQGLTEDELAYLFGEEGG